MVSRIAFVLLALHGVAAAGELAPLDKLIGDWDCRGVFVKSGKPIASTVHVAATLDGHWLTMQQDDRPPNVFHATAMWGYDPERHQLRSLLFDSSGNLRVFTSPGWAGAQLTWTRSGERFLYELVSPRELRLTWQVQPPSQPWATGDTLTCRRLGAPAAL